MSVRIRVYPAGQTAGMYGQGVGAVSAQTYYTSKLQNQQQVSNLQLQYERALWGERLEKTKLEEQLKNPYLALNATAGLTGLGGLGGLAGLSGLAGLGGLGAGGLTGLQGGLPLGYGGGAAGQSNATNQTSTGAATQTVSNVNTNNQSMQQVPQYGYGGVYGGYAGQGLFSQIGRALFG